MNLLYRLRTGWTAIKFVRLALASLILFSAIGSGQVGGMIVGSLFMLLSLFTDGTCCAGGACYTPGKKNDHSAIENTPYEELGTK